MSVFNKKSFLFPYLIIASAIANVEQPKKQDHIVSIIDSLNNVITSGVSHTTLLSNSLNNNLTDAEYVFNLSNSIFNQNSISEISAVIDTKKYSFPLVKLSENYSNKNNTFFNKAHYKNINSNNIVFQSKKDLYPNNNSIYYNFLLLLLSLGLSSVIGYFIYYQNKKSIILRIYSFKSLFRFKKNCGFNSFWKYQKFLSSCINYLNYLQFQIIFSISNISRNFVNIFVADTKHYSIP